VTNVQMKIALADVAETFQKSPFHDLFSTGWKCFLSCREERLDFSYVPQKFAFASVLPLLYLLYAVLHQRLKSTFSMSKAQHLTMSKPVFQTKYKCQNTATAARKCLNM